MMIKSIKDYLYQLKKELTGSDSATVQDALSDAEEHLRTALNNAMEGQSSVSEADALPLIIEKYGPPADIATAYREIESRVQPAFVRHEQTDKRSIISQFFGVFAEPRAWGALLYLLFSLVTGILYFTWAITGISLSFGFLILIIGLPFAGLFLLSVRGIALIEGRIVEALLGIRMPRRPLFSRRNIGWWPQLKALVVEKRTWITMLYMILQLPLGIIYFTLFIVLLSLSLGLIAEPFLELSFEQPFIILNNTVYETPVWLMPVIIAIGLLLLTATMHLARFIAREHGTLAKAMLVRT